MIARVTVVSKQTQWAKPGELFVVDLAGSENTADSATHDKERNNETKFINTSLMTLKDCIRARALASTSSKHLHIPYRRSPLTLLLRDCFEIAVRRPTKTVVVACVSPLLRDVRHTINTLRYASLLAITPPARVI
uniref:Diatom spindle kinesin 1 n=1 Tax=Lygus hesperus TaxID=30085 RepID=A0A0A9YU13_LYGHE